LILSLIYQTIIIVILLTFSFGPAFFALINIGIKHDYKHGALLAAGVVFSDLFVCLIVIFSVHYGAVNFLQDEKNQRFAGIVAGIILCVFGAFHYRKPISKSEESIEIQAPSNKVLVLKGFFLNLFNPAVWFLWLGNVTAVGKSFSYSLVKMIIYFSLVLGLVFTVELFKVFLAGKIKKFLTDRTMHLINYITGTLLIIFGVVLIYNHFFHE
jgi:threonine/homoserine/homoserine lactone efflux protein